MRSIIRYGTEKRVVIYFICLLLFIGGIASFFTLGQLEDPVFSVKTAVITTNYPGASPKEVELEVTDRLETAIQEMPQIKNLYSLSKAGQSIIQIDIKEKYWSDKLPQIWDELRRKISDTVPKLPPGVEKPIIGDDFGFVYGFLLALTGDGYSYKEMEEYAKVIKKELSLVKDVSRVELWGVQPKVIYLDVAQKQLANLRLTPETFLSTLKNQNMVVDAGNVDVESNRYRISPTGEFKSPKEIGELLLRPHPNDLIANIMSAEKDDSRMDSLESIIKVESDKTILIKDVATVREGYREPSVTLMRYNGQPAIGIQIAGTEDSNIVDVGNRLYDKLDEVLKRQPAGIDIHKVAWQSDLVSEAVNGFLINLVEAIIIVMIVLIIPSGLRMGFIIGIDLILTILGTFIVMSIMGIPLQRMSLGALIIALGMMVDNSIVISDAIAVKLRQGIDRTTAAIDAAHQNAFPLFAATLIAVMTFFPIYISQASAGEYCRTLFIVVAAALILSWFIAIMITPLQCIDMLPDPEKKEGAEFSGAFFEKFRQVLRFLIKKRYLTTLILVGMLIVAWFGFGYVKRMFFPDSTRPQLMVDLWAPAGTRIQDVSESVKALEEKFMQDPLVESVTTFIGAGPPRFYLPVNPEKNYQNYAQVIVNFRDYMGIEPFITTHESWAEQNFPNALIRFRKYGVGPGDTWKFEMRLTGPGQADMETLRNLGNEFMEIAGSSPYGKDWLLDIQNPTLKLVPEYDQKRGRWAGVDRPDLANATQRAYDGTQVGLYREGDSLYPIILRNSEEERAQFANDIETTQIRPSQTTNTVPLSQVVNKINPEWENPIIARWDRRRVATVQGGPLEGITFPTLYDSVIDQINAVKLPPGYEIFWDGEYDSTLTAQQELVPGIIPTVIIILLLLVITFNAMRPVIIILITIPFALIGIVLGLLVFDQPFGFMALLGAMSLAGMMNKNIVVLLDACNAFLSKGMSREEAITESSVSRARPVLLAAGTTILGVIPLVTDVFWVSMAITIMAGLAFGSLLTLIAVPVFYAIFYRVKLPKTPVQGAPHEKT